MDIAKEAIKRLSDFFFNTLQLTSNFTDLNIDETNFEIMAKKSCEDSILEGFKPLNQKDIKKIYEMCL
ncbi:hypothetical protein SDC9_190668 [bioreactor metagenome]|uniref:Fe-containing alcohol dehydrogenase-like C-terminal domain-containing protein n=2 Tax=root TaxID=1 RepID=A0A645HY49_9ZZZZ